MGGLGLPSASLLATSCFLSSASSCAALSDQISTCTGPTGDEETALELWGDTAQALPPTNRSTQKNWTWPVFENLITSMLVNCSKTDHNRIEAYSGKMAGSWQQALPSSNLGLKLTDIQLRISVALRLGGKVCEPHQCRCGKEVSEDGHHGLACKMSAGRHTRHSLLNDIVKRGLASANIHSVLESPGLCRADRKRPDGLTSTPWSRGQPMVWDATVVDALCSSRIDSFEPLKAATTAEETKRMKYTEIINRGYLFQPVAFEVQGGAGPDTKRFLSKLGKLIQDSTNEARASAFLRQRISVCIQMSNAACVIGTLRP